MLYDGITMVGGSSANVTIESGVSFPSNPEMGKLFYLTLLVGEDHPGLYVFDGVKWVTGDVSGVEVGYGMTGGGTGGKVSIGIDSNVIASKSDITTLTSGLNTTSTAVAALQSDLSDEITRSMNADGNLENLTTAIQTDLVSAVNEVNGKVATNTNRIATNETAIGNLDSELTAEVNRASAAEGVLSSLTTTDKGSLVAAVNEVNALALDQTATKLKVARTISVSGDISGSASFDGSANVTIASTLPNTGVTAGTVGSGTSVPVVTVDAKGRVQTLTTAAIPTGSDAVAGLVKINNTVTSTATDTAATTAAVKTAYDLASTANATATAAVPQNQLGANNGVATLDGNGKVPATQLPSFVDDVLEYPLLADFPATGASGVIYVAEDSGRVYRWTGSVYVEISSAATADTAIKLSTPRTITVSGDVDGSVAFDGSANVTIVAALDTTGVTAGTYGSDIAASVVTIDDKGRITTASTTTIRSASTSVTGVVQLSDSTSSTSTTMAATPNAVKTAFDMASGKLAASGGVATDLQLNQSKYRQAPNQSAASGTVTLDYANGDVFNVTATGNITIALSNMPSGFVSCVILEAVNFGSRTITWPTGVKWAGGTVPTLTAAGRDLIMFMRDSAGTVSASVLGKDFK